MNGILNQQMAPTQAPVDSAQDVAQGIDDPGADISPRGIRESLNLPPNMKEPYQRIVLAGMKVMFDPSTHKIMVESLQGDAPTPQKLGDGVAKLMLILWEQSKKTLPPQLLIPAMLELMAHAVDYLKKTGQDVTPQDFGQAADIGIGLLLKAFGVDPDKIGAPAAPQGAM